MKDITGENMEQNKKRTSCYLLRNIPADLWTQAKHKAVDEGLSLRALILKALQAYLR